MSAHALGSATSTAADARRLRHAFVAATSFAAFLWVLKLAETALGLHLLEFGVYPGRLDRLASIAWAPLLHGSFSHLFANTGALIILGTALLYGYPNSAKVVIPVVYIGSGLGVWLFGRHAYHVGASGLTFGMMFFVFTIGILRWDKRAIALSLLVFFLYGGMIWGIFPGDPAISFESHFFGAAIGITLAFLLKNRDPAPPQKRYSWEDDDDDMDPDAATPRRDAPPSKPANSQTDPTASGFVVSEPGIEFGLHAPPLLQPAS